jgi:hypothetical protein
MSIVGFLQNITREVKEEFKSSQSVSELEREFFDGRFREHKYMDLQLITGLRATIARLNL